MYQKIPMKKKFLVLYYFSNCFSNITNFILKKQKLLVYFLRKTYNDDHFDLNNMNQLTGKTIYFASKNCQKLNSTLKKNLQVLNL